MSKTSSGEKQKLTDGDLARLVSTLETQKRLGGIAYPPTLGRLLNLAGMSPDYAKLLKTKGRKRLLITAKRTARTEKMNSALVALPQDADALAGSPALLAHCLKEASTAKTQMFPFGELAGTLAGSLVPPFKSAWKPRVEQGELPPGLGALRRGGHAYLFLLEDIVSAQGTQSAAVASPDIQQEHAPDLDSKQDSAPRNGGEHQASSLPERVLATFDELDRQAGRRNYVTLSALRGMLSDVTRESLDAVINQLRREKLVSLDSADGRHQRLCDEELAAAIIEDGSRLVYMARRHA